MSPGPGRADVSIIVPTHDRAALLGDALASCFAAAAGGPVVQVVVVDDASTDDTPALLAAHAGRLDVVVLETNQGAARARNVGLARAVGTYVKFLDSDDTLVPDVLAREVELAERERADMVLTGWGTVRIDAARRHVAGTETRHSPPDLQPLPDSLLQGRAVPTSSVLYRRAYVSGLEWDPETSPLDDWDWFCRAALGMGRVARLDGVSYWMRAHEGPRVTSPHRMLERARAHHRVLAKLEGWLRARGELEAARSRRLAQYYYKELRVLCLHDRPAFERALTHILDLDPAFRPRDEERPMRVLVGLLGVRRAFLAHTRIKRILRRPE